MLTGTSSRRRPVLGQDVIIGIGQLTLVALGGGLVVLARGGLRAENSRRGLNVVWDVIAFWPRSVHPFVPPPYAQEVVPALVRRSAGISGCGPAAGLSPGAAVTGDGDGGYGEGYGSTPPADDGRLRCSPGTARARSCRSWRCCGCRPRPARGCAG